MAIQTAPGTLAIVSQLSAGIGAESVAMAEIGRASNIMASKMNDCAQDEYQNGLEMTKLIEIAKWVQLGTICLTALTLGVGSVATVGLEGGTFGVVQGLSAVANGVAQGGQGVMAVGQGSLQFVQKDKQGTIQIDETEIGAVTRSTSSSSDAIKEMSQGASKLASAIAEMASSTGAIARQRIS